MKSGFVDKCLSIARLVASIQPVFEHINGCGINFYTRLDSHGMMTSLELALFVDLIHGVIKSRFWL